MSHALHLLPNNVPGYGPTDCRYRSYSGISGRAVTLFPCSSHSHHRICTQVKIRSLKCISRGISVVCRAGSSGQRRNPDFSRKRHGFQGKKGQNEERVNLENIDESEMISSKNGTLLSLSGSTKFQAAAAPGPREKEIVEFFRKVQAKLKERAAVKEDEKTEASQGKGKESETVDSLLKLLRKHSVEHGNSRHLNLDDSEVNSSSDGDKGSSFFGSNDRARSETKESYVPSSSRPASNFRRKSPVPQMKYQTIYSGEETTNSVTHFNSDRKRNLSLESHPAADNVPEVEEELESESKPEDELELEPESIYQDSDALNELSEDESSDIDEEDGEQRIEREDLSPLKLPELRALAKSHGLKGFSKMKKGDLVSLLSSSG
ncbi:rho-N domain-containing protein 1 [Hibiscus syriacus]|uniref:Rho-N domain-containing protein 1 n=1 Tax=Hibiscus syriacus TaxID=106335 RepID=A0A6A2Z097_HIBSY|nr:rho-N domain-containing protein 1, chloroplastic-like [Hibiscus syriacus]KAE8684592.1 rho-N domain-containing protein 1 [Hibiscus syriacus]